MTCSGTRVAADWVLTAAHCALSGPLIVRDPLAPEATEPVDRQELHPSEDVALVHTSPGGTVPSPLAIADGTVRLEPGDAVEMAGYGTTETGEHGTLSFRVQPVSLVTNDAVVVNGAGRGGACAGDSGGPLLVRESDGAAAVLGVLSVGSSTCVDDDVYVRVDALRDWIVEITGGDAGSAPEDCGGIGEEGRCFYGAAVWCDGGAIAGSACAGGSRCGWDTAQAGFRCVSPEADPCDGIDALGRCGDTGPMFCDRGTLVPTRCDCASCVVDGASGAPRCSGD